MIKRKVIEVRPRKELELVSFGFSKLCEISYNDARNDAKYFIDFIGHLKRFSQLSWSTILTTQRHGFGSETLKVSELNIRARNNVPSGIDKLIVLRSTGDNHSFLGIRENNVFQVLFIEYQFGDIYNH